MAEIGISARATAGYRTDGAGQTYTLGEAYPVSRIPVGETNPVTFGWDALLTANARDRSATGDSRLAGTIYTTHTAPRTLRIDLPAVGNRPIRLALGDAGGGVTNIARMYDNGVLFATIGPTPTSGARFLDAHGVEYTEAGWVANNTPITHNFTSTRWEIVIGDGESTGLSEFAHVSFGDVVAGPTAPGAPTIGSATSSSVGSVSVSGTAPASNGGSAITSYIATSSLGEIASSATLPVAFSGLSNVARTFHLQAVNAVGTSVPSAESNSVTPMAATVPAAPSLGTATAGNGSVTIPFTVNGSGGSAILDTTITLSPGGATGTYTGSGSGSITISGLANGTSYTGTGKSRNAVGSSVASAVSNSVTPTAANAVPTFPGPNIVDIAGTQGVAIASVDISSKFADGGDTKTYSKSPAGTTWPTGVSVDASTGVISGTPTSAGSTTGCKVRDTDSAGQVVDSNAFAFNIAAPAAGSFTTDQIISNTDTIRASEAVTYTWYKGGVVGSAAGTATTGSGTLSAAGVLIATGLPAGAGFMMVKTADGGIFYQAGTVA